MIQKNRVVITGMGAVSPVGCEIDEIWNNISNGISGITGIDKEKYHELPINVGGFVQGLNEEEYLSKRDLKFSSRFVSLGRIAAKKAYVNAGFDDDSDMENTGVLISSSVGGADIIEESFRTNKTGPFFIPQIMNNSAASNVAMDINAHGTCFSTVSACAGSAQAIGEAFRKISYGEADVIFAGGADYPFTSKAIGGFYVMQAVYRGDDLSRASIPFDSARSGFVPAEGAAVLVLEEYEHAIKRGAKILGEIVGYGSTCDAYHPTAPRADAKYEIKTILNAISEAGISKEEIGYINAHGTGTKLNDSAECLAIKTVFEDAVKKPFVSSTKSMTGHMLSATGAMEAIICLKALEKGFLPPNVNLLEPDSEIDVNLIGSKGLDTETKYAMSNSFGFGGHNVSLIFKRY